MTYNDSLYEPGEPYEVLLRESLKGELKVLNAHLPRKAKTLSELLNEEHPYVLCQDGSAHLIKKGELEYLADLLDAEEKDKLLLPILIRVVSENEMEIICRSDVEEKVITSILKIPVTRKQGVITVYKHQISLLRRILKTTTQYVFSAKLSG